VDIELGLSQLSDLKVVDDPGTHVCVCAQAVAMCTLSGATRAVAMCTLNGGTQQYVHRYHTAM